MMFARLPFIAPVVPCDDARAKRQATGNWLEQWITRSHKNRN